MFKQVDKFLETQEGKNLPVPHCIRGTIGWELNPEIEALRKVEAFDTPANLLKNNAIYQEIYNSQTPVFFLLKQKER